MGEKYLKTKEGSIEDVVKNLQNKVLETDYKDNFKKELDKAGKPIGHMTGMEKKEFYNKVESVQETIRIRPKNAINEDGKLKEAMPGGANSSSKRGSASRGKKRSYRFGYRVSEKDPSVKEGFYDTKTFAQMAEDLKDLKKKKSPEKTAKVEPSSSKDSKDTPKDADALEKQLVVAQGQINLLKQKIENEKNKIVKPEPNKETGEVPLTIGIAYKHLKDKEKKEGDKTAAPNREVKESKVKENIAKKQNASQRSKGGEKSPISHMVNKSIKEITANDNKTFAQIAAEIREGKGPKNAPDGESDKKKEAEADTDTRDPKKKTMSGKIATSPEMNPRVDYKY
jgi:hypothetical protein